MDDIVARLADINNRLGFISREHVELLAKELELPPAKVFGAATFYSMFRTQPRGKHIVRFCEDAPCHVAGGRAVFDAIRAALGLEPGQTSADGRWTLEMTSCLGVCGVAPVMMVDDTVYGNLTPEKVTQLLATVEQSISN
jgi:NADH-quinone oxidoreductase subunit E